MSNTQFQDWTERFVVDPDVARGKLVVKGTRLLAEDLAGQVEEGQSDEELLRRHPELTVEDMAAVRQYARVPAGLRRSFGAWAEDGDELDKFLEWNRQQRKLSRREINVKDYAGIPGLTIDDWLAP